VFKEGPCGPFFYLPCFFIGALLDLTDEYLHRFSGVGRLYGFEALKKLSQSHVAVVGLGGIGSWVVEALARSGIGELTLIDHDDICVSNFNRQVHATDHSLGKFKVQAMADRVRSINSTCRLHVVQEQFSAATADALILSKFDHVIDAIDGIHAKCLLIEECKKKEIPILVMGSVGGKRNPLLVKVDDLSRSIEDQLLMYVKKKLRQEFDYPRNKKAFGVTCVFSSERPVYFTEECISLQKPKDLLKPLDCQTGMGTATFLSGAFGFVAASQVVDRLLLPV
jgi:tRNA A37 threonylcarbamoyladenosine dehydratase